MFGPYKTFQISVRQVADGTGLNFSSLIPFDGFSHHEATTGKRVANRIDRIWIRFGCDPRLVAHPRRRAVPVGTPGGTHVHRPRAEQPRPVSVHLVSYGT